MAIEPMDMKTFRDILLKVADKIGVEGDVTYVYLSDECQLPIVPVSGGRVNVLEKRLGYKHWFTVVERGERIHITEYCCCGRIEDDIAALLKGASLS